jgi:ADP-heptose:LPS heptosyltransferase
VNALLSDKVEIPYSKTLIVDEEITPRKVAVSEDSKEVMRRRIKEAYPALDERIHKVVLFNTDASELIPLRRWPREYYIGLAGMILDRYPDIIILLTGNQTERAGKEGIIAAVRNGRCVNFAGLTSIHDLPALYSVSSFMLTNDSGPAHIASVSEMPVFVLFGPETPRAYGPLGTMTPIYAGLACSPCVSAVNHKKSACNDNVCLQVITPEKVFHALQPSLELFCHAEGSRAADV